MQQTRYYELQEDYKQCIVDITYEEGESYTTYFILEFNKLCIQDSEIHTIELLSY